MMMIKFHIYIPVTWNTVCLSLQWTYPNVNHNLGKKRSDIYPK